MNYLELLNQIFQVCIIPLLGVLTGFLVKWLNSKSTELQTKIDNELFTKYITMLQDTIVNCVIATNQTYVNALKEKDAFDAEAQKHAFQLTYNSIMAILTEDAKTYLSQACGDLQTYITTQIESAVKANK